MSGLGFRKSNKVQILKDAIQEGIDSGVAEDFNPDKFLQELKSKKKNG